MITQMRSNVNEKIIEFIGNFYKSNDKSHEECEVIRKQFRNGYCYHFAVILRDLFPGGEMCIAAPFGHIVYVYENIPYDVEGVYDGEATDFIPIYSQAFSTIPTFFNPSMSYLANPVSCISSMFIGSMYWPSSPINEP